MCIFHFKAHIVKCLTELFFVNTVQASASFMHVVSPVTQLHRGAHWGSSNIQTICGTVCHGHITSSVLSCLGKAWFSQFTEGSA